MPDDAPDQPPHPGGCGLQACLVIAMIVCGLLVAAMIGLVIIRHAGMQ